MDEKRRRFEAQVMPHLDAAYRFARWLTRSSSEADDVVQEAFLRAFRAFDSLRGTDVKSWLLAIVRNCHVTSVRQEQRRGFQPLPDQDDAAVVPATLAAPPDPETASIEDEERRRLARLLAGLGVEHREVLLLREMEDLSYREIAAVTQLPIGTVMSRLARARAALKLSWLKDSAGEPRAMR
jgi:RNA polymerase sigma-70 factor (ECF subfamily)